MNRRQFVHRLEGVVGGCAALSAGGCIPFYFANATVAGGRLRVRVDELGARGFALIDPPGGDLPIFLQRLADGSFSAVSTRCMHRGCPVEPAADKLVCPCHGSEYTTTGEVLKGPTERPLRTFPAKVEGDHVVIDL